MSTHSLSAQLASIVEQAVEQHNLVKFAQYWELYLNTTDLQGIEGFFVRTEVQGHAIGYTGGAYCNVAIIGGGLLIDIDGDDGDNTGSLTFHPLESVSGIEIHAEPLRGLDASRGALLVVLAYRVGEEDIGLHWVAKTEQEKEHLLKFARVLVSEISADWKSEE